MSLLQVIQDACREMGFPAPSSIVGSADVTAIQMLAVSKSSVKDLAREAPWQRMTTQYTFVAFATASQASYSLPSDWDRFIDNTHWDSTNDRPMIGPMSPQEWQILIRGSLGGAGVDTYWRLIGNSLYLYPVQTSGSTVMAYDYISKNAVETSGGTAKETFTADGDVPRFDEQLFKLDIIWRFKKEKGLPYAEEKLSFDEYLTTAKSRNGGARTLNMSGRKLTDILSVNIQEANFTSN